MEEFKNTEDFQQISDDEITQNDVEGSGNPLKGSVADNQAVFDRLPKLIAGKVNALIEFVNNIKNFFIAHLNDTENPHKVTASQVKSDSNSNITVESHINSKENPHNVTKEQVGLSNVDNTSDMDKPVSNAVQEELDDKTPLGAYHELYDETHNHFDNTQNPHNVTKSQVGLSNVDNTSDMDKPVSNAVKNFVFEQEAATLIPVLEALNGHKDSESNPHKVTKEQVGLSNADNTSDMDKPVSNAVQKVLDKLNRCIAYRRIYEFSVGEDGVTNFEFNKDSEGNSFNLDGVVVDIYSPEPITTEKIWSCYVNSVGSGKSLFYFNNIGATSNGGSVAGKKYMKIKADRYDSGNWWNMRYAKWMSATTGAEYHSNYVLSPINYINSFYVSLPEAPVGTTIKFYGKEANI